MGLLQANGVGGDIHLVVLLHLLILHRAAVALHGVLEEEEQLRVCDDQAVQITFFAIFGRNLLALHTLVVVLLQPRNACGVSGEGRLVHFFPLSYWEAMVREVNDHTTLQRRNKQTTTQKKSLEFPMKEVPGFANWTVTEVNRRV